MKHRSALGNRRDILLATVFIVLLAVSHFLLMGYRKQVSHDFRMVCKKAVAPLQTPIIILGGILVGVFTPTEAGAVGALTAPGSLPSLTAPDSGASSPRDAGCRP